METLIGMIAMFGCNFDPQNWAYCDGRLLPISQYDALFSLIGTTYGGDGVTTFGLPDLRGRMAIGWGQGPGQPLYVIGEKAGAESASLTINSMPAHRHTVNATTEEGNTNAPEGAFLANSLQIDKEYKTAPSEESKVLMHASMVNSSAGNAQSFSVIQPTLAVNYCIALYGVYPSRN